MARQASQKYAEESSLLRQWLAEGAVIEREGLEMFTLDAFKQWKKFVHGLTGKHPNISVVAFRDILKAACPSIEFGHSRKRETSNKSIIKGFGNEPLEGLEDDPAGGNVVQLRP